MSRQVVATTKQIEEALKGSGLTKTEFLYRLTKIKSDPRFETPPKTLPQVRINGLKSVLIDARNDLRYAKGTAEKAHGIGIEKTLTKIDGALKKLGHFENRDEEI